jgi:hypothetical protein
VFPLRSIALVVVVALGTALRLLGISFGLPYHHHWDEGWITNSVVGMLHRHDTVPASYQYGEPLMWLTEVVCRLFQWAHHRGGEIGSVDAETTVYLAARVATALVSSTGIVAMYVAVRFSRREGASSRAAALGAALLYAVSSELVVHSRYAVTDACLVALTAWTLAVTAVYLTRRTVVWGVLSALAAGITCAFKVPGIVTSLIPILASLSLYVGAPKLGQARRAYGALLLATIPIVAVTYVAFNPHLVDRTGDAMRDLVGRYRQTRDGGFSSCYLRTPGLPHLLSAVAAIVTQFLSRNVGVAVILTAVSLWGLASNLRRDRLVAIAAAYGACLILSVALPNRTFLYRNYLVVIPVLCLGFGSGLVDLANVLAARLREHGAVGRIALSGLGLAAAVAVVGLPLHDAIGAQRLHDDPRVRAIDWIGQQARDGSPEDVAVTSSVFGKSGMGGWADLQTLVQPPSIKFAAESLETCPVAPGGPQYVLDASYRDTHRAPASDPWQELWFFQECPGYERVATFEANPYEVNPNAYPTWLGRVSATVLRRKD